MSASVDRIAALVADIVEFNFIECGPAAQEAGTARVADINGRRHPRLCCRGRDSCGCRYRCHWPARRRKLLAIANCCAAPVENVLRNAFATLRIIPSSTSPSRRTAYTGRNHDPRLRPGVPSKRSLKSSIPSSASKRRAMPWRRSASACHRQTSGASASRHHHCGERISRPARADYSPPPFSRQPALAPACLHDLPHASVDYRILGPPL